MKGMKTHKKARHLKWTHPLCPSAGRDTETSAFRVLSVQGQLPCPQFSFRGMASYPYVCFLTHGQAEIVLQAVGRITWEQRRKTSPEASVQTASQRQVMVDNISLILTLQRLLALWLLYYSIETRGMPRTHLCGAFKTLPCLKSVDSGPPATLKTLKLLKDCKDAPVCALNFFTGQGILQLTARISRRRSTKKEFDDITEAKVEARHHCQEYHATLSQFPWQHCWNCWHFVR